MSKRTAADIGRTWARRMLASGKTLRPNPRLEAMRDRLERAADAVADSQFSSRTTRELPGGVTAEEVR